MSNKDVTLILASGSPRRRELMQQIGLSFEVMPAKGEEKITSDEPSEVVKELALQKALEVFNKKTSENFPTKNKSIIVIGADTVVSYRHKILGKPKDRADAIRTISSLQGDCHEVYTGVAIVFQDAEPFDPVRFFFQDENGQMKCDICAEETQVEVYPMSQEEILRYCDSGEPYDKAGSYGIQGAFAAYVKGIRGDYNNVVGLPIARVYQTLKQHVLL